MPMILTSVFVAIKRKKRFTMLNISVFLKPDIQLQSYDQGTTFRFCHLYGRINKLSALNVQFLVTPCDTMTAELSGKLCSIKNLVFHRSGLCGNYSVALFSFQSG